MYYDVRIGNFRGDFERAIRMYSEDFSPLTVGIESVKKYILSKIWGLEPYILLASLDHPPPPRQDYNVMFTVHGPQKSGVIYLLNEIAERIPIEVKEAPEELKEKQRLAMAVYTELIKGLEKQMRN